MVVHLLLRLQDLVVNGGDDASGASQKAVSRAEPVDAVLLLAVLEVGVSLVKHLGLSFRRLYNLHARGIWKYFSGWLAKYF